MPEIKNKTSSGPLVRDLSVGKMPCGVISGTNGDIDHANILRL